MKISKLKVAPKPSSSERAASASRGLTVRSAVRGGPIVSTGYVI